MIELPKLIAELAASPIRIQQRMDTAWLIELARTPALPIQPGNDFPAQFPELAAVLVPGRPFLHKYEINVSIRLQVAHTVAFSLLAEPANGVWQSIFGADANAPKLGAAYRHQTKTSQETGIHLEIVQIPLPEIPPEIRATLPPAEKGTHTI